MEFIKHNITGYFVILNDKKIDSGRIYETSDGWFAEVFDLAGSSELRSIADKIDELNNANYKP